MNTIALSPTELKTVQDILNALVPNQLVWAFGSRVTGTHKPWSDLDLAIITHEPLSLDTQTALENAFADSDLPFKVDVVDWATTNGAFRDIIQKQKKIIQSINT